MGSRSIITPNNDWARVYGATSVPHASHCNSADWVCRRHIIEIQQPQRLELHKSLYFSFQYLWRMTQMKFCWIPCARLLLETRVCEAQCVISGRDTQKKKYLNIIKKKSYRSYKTFNKYKRFLIRTWFW